MMDSSQLDQADKNSPETCSDSSLSPDSPDSNDIFREPLVHPRVGDEYQVEIPFMLKQSELLQLMVNPADSNGAKDYSQSFLLGLPVPVMWIYPQANLIKESTVESEKSARANHFFSVEEVLKVKADYSSQTRCVVPGQSSTSWTDFEADCFLLALYIFGKNLLQVERFMESKRVGQILSYYYGQFYGSTAYRKWSECRKMRNRRCVLGHRFFTGYRQHELFSRLGPRLSEESKTKYMEVSRAFIEGRTTLEEYVFSLKALVGIHALVEAVGIGKGKDDLSTLIFDGTKNNQLFSHRPEIPSGKACSSLTCAEIVKYLTGDFRLSKARSNDLFWEAVWPRLLARGWHSEQPRGENYAGQKNCLVFLMPGIKKFSRKKLLKGDHYFDSVSDVLAKVAGEPELLELETDETKPSPTKVDNGWAVEVKSDDDPDLSDRERHCYLKPRVSSNISDLFKFTVVDTSHEDYPSRVRELKTLPIEAKSCSTFRKADTMRNGLQTSATSPHSGLVTNTDVGSERLSGGHNLVPLEKAADVNLPKDHRSRTIKHQFSRRVKPGLTSCSSSQAMKRRRLTSCDEAELTFVLSLPARTCKIKIKGKNVAASKPMMTNNIVLPRVNQYDDVKVTSTKTLVGGTSTSCSDISQEKEILAQEPKLIDLNLPQIDPESEGKVKPEAGSESDDKINLEGANSNKPEYSDAKDQLMSSAAGGTTNNSGDTLDQQQPRRQSTRNRPLTTKALEALEIGFLSPIRHSRKRSPSTLQEQKPKRSRQPRSKNSILPAVVDSEVGEVADENCNRKMSETLGLKISVEKASMPPDLLVLPESSFALTASSKETFT